MSVPHITTSVVANVYIGVVSNTSSAVSFSLTERIPGKIVTVKDENGNAGAYNITITDSLGYLIDGQASYILNTAYQSVDLYWNGAAWEVKATNSKIIVNQAANLPAASAAGVGAAVFATDTGSGSELISNGSSYAPPVTQSPYYFFHGFANNLVAGEKGFYDMSLSGNTAVTQANNSAAFSNAGYVSTVATTSAAGFTMPNLNFDYLNGETLIWWILQITSATGGNVTYGGDGYGNSHPGFRLRSNSLPGFDFSLTSSTLTGFSSISAVNPFDGTLHSFGGIVGNGLYNILIDETPDSVIGAGNSYAAFDAGAKIDTRTNGNFNLGNTPNSGTDSIATEIRAAAIFRLPAGKAMPQLWQVQNLFQQLRYNPSQLAGNAVF